MKKILQNGQKVMYYLMGRRSWYVFEYFDPKWKMRIQEMAKYIPSGASVMDLGCGMMWLKRYIPQNQYFPVDYTDRGNDTIICDFNKNEFPNKKADVAFASGVLEYIDDTDWFVNCISQNCRECILSYCTLENYPDLNFRHKQSWVNNFTNREIIELFASHKFKLVTEDNSIPRNKIFYFKKSYEF